MRIKFVDVTITVYLLNNVDYTLLYILFLSGFTLSLQNIHES